MKILTKRNQKQNEIQVKEENTTNKSNSKKEIVSSGTSKILKVMILQKVV